ncbi:hypothetical protein GN244_ATG12339 [Phytophthora infestans]|uniref:Uncharacterized protein n=1 Tax=Phytophthora infestans TaxID=4787 RepID=A0A833WAL1_PHYIN|nr:hypothetical protein GN244_ATG12339 [Phytophthora infestans]KAF4137196.1 hypothetical protein GN958_ATG13604 [Phytophthora infestans]
MSAGLLCSPRTFLRRNEIYERAFQQTLLKGDDTDTNAAIKGKVLGWITNADIKGGLLGAEYWRGGAYSISHARSCGKTGPVDYCVVQVTKEAEKLFNGDRVN